MTMWPNSVDRPTLLRRLRARNQEKSIFNLRHICKQLETIENSFVMPQMEGQQAGPPYVPNVAGVGGRPTTLPDIPIIAVFLFIYVCGAASNMTIFQLNRRKGHKFIPSVAMFGFCMSRIATFTLRLVWATRPTNAKIAIAAQIFVNVGVLIIYIIVLLLCVRLFRATHPRLGWYPLISRGLKVLYVLLFCAIVLVIAFTIQSFYTLDMTLRKDAMWIQRASILYMLIFNVISLVLYTWAVLLPPASNHENFGNSSMLSKKIILGVALFFTLFIAGFRTGTTWAPSRPANNPAWYQSKAAFYTIEMAFEIVVVYLFIFTRFDKKFWIPNGSKGPGDFSRVQGEVEDKPSRVSDTSV
ncbi:Hypothetical protein R9X50_00169400 [Acrodontium crateriforme]|uniref:Uncharacterized protein n=1 Tax=Acrodontium crateriforme TaxID=150365 RepID=A0AAQ3M164_9PEZI|nr:Hypothetical protein R9X50_00169400 [Acrodontium crateriforme]